MRQRRFPFGYTFSDGQIAVHDEEARAVRRIFGAYIRGGSLLSIAKSLMENGVSYFTDCPDWNKNMVKRILEDKRYLGTEGYPQIMDGESFERANAIRQDRQTRPTEPETMRTIRMRAVCAECGAKIRRHAKHPGHTHWYCKNGCRLSTVLMDKHIQESIVRLLNGIIDSPSRLEIPAELAPGESPEVLRLSREICREMEKPEGGVRQLHALLLERAAAAYAQLPDVTLARQARDLRSELVRRERLTEFDEALFERAVDAVLLHPDGHISLRLINGQILG